VGGGCGGEVDGRIVGGIRRRRRGRKTLSTRGF
jgi:hypothetical protein